MALLAACLGGTTMKGCLDRREVRTENAMLSNRLGEMKGQVEKTVELAEAMQKQPTLERIAEVVARVAPSTVRIDTDRNYASGIIIRDIKQDKLYVMTNGHVVTDRATNTNQNETFRVTLHNGSDFQPRIEFEARVATLPNGIIAASSMQERDIALLEISPGATLPPNVKPALFRDVGKAPLKVGEFVVAVGNPYGYSDNFTHGTISHTDRRDLRERHNKFVAIDAPINVGNSGGGLFDMEGRLIGMNTLGTPNADGLGGAIRIDNVLEVLNEWGVSVELAK